MVPSACTRFLGFKAFYQVTKAA
jgi:hypothetical protein